MGKEEVKYEKESEEPLFEDSYKGFTVRAWYLAGEYKHKALIEIERDGKFYKRFFVEAYKVYNIAAHFIDMVDAELSNESIDEALSPLPWGSVTRGGNLT